MSNFLDFLSWLFAERGPTGLGGLLLDFARRPSFMFYFALTLLAAVLIVCFVLRFAFPRISRIGPPRWGVWTGLLVTLCAVLVMAAVHYNVSLVLEKTKAVSPEVINSRSVSITALIAAPIICIGGFLVLRTAARAGRGDLSVDFRNPPGMLLNFLRGHLLMAALIPLVIIIAFINALFLNSIGADMYEQDVVQMMRQETSPLFAGLMYAMALLAAPVWEEFIFRGVLYNGLRKSMGRDEAILISALIFGCIHGSVLAFMPIFVLAIFLAYAYERTGSLLTPIAMHFLFNLWGIILIHMS